ncbi:type II secretion system protein [Candidatus Beckwithbacteria bacterium]|nr:type II secretion system protein [Candidatus Beckwithbacteria bacterium]
MKQNQFKQGFTLVELLIVITLIGILAVAVLAAINPIEQFNKANDTARKTDAGQVLNAIERYYTSNGMFPWNASKTDVNTAISFVLEGNNVTGTGPNTMDTTTLDVLTDDGELKKTFLNKYIHGAALGPNEKLYVYKPANISEVKVCFQPQSKSVAKEAMKVSGTGYTVGNPLAADVTFEALAEGDSCFSGTSQVPCFICMPGFDESVAPANP